MKTTATMKKLIIMTLAVVISTAFLFAESVETSYAGSEYSSTAEVGQYMLNGINNHDSDISFSYVTSDSDPMTLSKDLFEAALSASDMSVLGVACDHCGHRSYIHRISLLQKRCRRPAEIGRIGIHLQYSHCSPPF